MSASGAKFRARDNCTGIRQHQSRWLLVVTFQLSFERGRKKEQHMLGTILIVLLVLALFGALPRWSHSRDWGYAPTGGLGLVLLIVVILLVLGRI
jgi:hypothetical protein